MADDLNTAPAVSRTHDDMLGALLERALRSGATDVAAGLNTSRSLNVSIRDGALESIGHAETARLGLTVYLGQRSASQTTTDLSSDSLSRLVDETMAAARAGEEDPYAGLPTPGLATSGDDRELDLVDPVEPTTAELRALATRVEAAARSVTGVVISHGGSASWTLREARSMTSQGVSRRAASSNFSVGAAVIAGDGTSKETGHKGSGGRWRNQLKDPRDVGLEAGRRAVEKLGARKPRSCTAPVIFDRTTAFTLLDPFFGALDGGAVHRKASFLIDRLGESVFPKAFQIIDDPHLVRGRGSAAVDSEGVRSRRRHIVEAGRLTTWLLNSYSARQLGLESTGHASGLFNVTVEPGGRNQTGLMEDAGSGLLVTTTFSPSLNSHNGDWSMGVGGFWFDKGEIQYPVSEVTVAGNLLELYRTLIAGSDLMIENAANSPSLLVERMTISGS